MTVARTLETERLVLRLPEPGDFPAYRDYCASVRSGFVDGPYSEALAFEKFAAMLGHWDLRGYGRYVITLNGRAIGYAGPLAPVEGQIPEMTWALWDSRFERNGYASEATEAVVNHLLDDCGWDTLRLHILPRNTAARAIAQRIGAIQTDGPAPDWFPGCLTYRLERSEVAA